jgi:hypothetical protein
LLRGFGPGGSAQFRQRGPHLGGRGGLGAVLAHHPHRFLDQREIGRLCAERRIFQADAEVAGAQAMPSLTMASTVCGMPGCHARHAPFSAASIQTLRMAFPVLSVE